MGLLQVTAPPLTMRLMTDPTVGPIEYLRNVGPELDERSCRWPEVGDPVSDGAGTRRADWGQPLRVRPREHDLPPPDKCAWRFPGRSFGAGPCGPPVWDDWRIVHRYFSRESARRQCEAEAVLVVEPGRSPWRPQGEAWACTRPRPWKHTVIRTLDKTWSRAAIPHRKQPLPLIPAIETSELQLMRHLPQR